MFIAFEREISVDERSTNNQATEIDCKSPKTDSVKPLVTQNNNGMKSREDSSELAKQTSSNTNDKSSDHEGDLLHTSEELQSSSECNAQNKTAESHEVGFCENIHEFDNLLKKLDFTKFYPQKFKAIASIMVREMETSENKRQLPYCILQMIMFLNSNFLNSLMSTNYKDDLSSFEGDGDSDEETETDAIHPVDVLLALVHCSDDFLRQVIYSKLATCQLAVPLLLPDPKKGTVTLMLWAMRSIVKEWRQSDGVSTEQRIVDCTAPIISFMRFGKLNQFSKSEMLSTILSEHSHFFYWDLIDGPTPKRRIVEGLVDVCWYLPSGRNDTFQNVVTFANLHGDCASHPKQTQFLAKASYMSFVLVSQVDELSESEKAMFQSLSQAPGGLVLVVCDKAAERNAKEFKNLYNCKLCIRKKKTIAKLTKEISTLIKSQLKEISTAKIFPSSILDCRTFAIDGIDFDDEKEGAAEICAMFKEASSKDELLPLQGSKLWGEWAKANKELHIKTKNKAKAENPTLDEIRNQQCNEIEKMESNCCINTFISSLKLQGEHFFQSMKLMLEDSCRIHSTLHGKLRILGIEHLFREIGQMYEAVTSANNKEHLKKLVSDLPYIAAKLLIEGHPLELMDGDVAHVPITWVKAVMTEVVRILHDPKVFVLSIVGVQSSGKSTLLNTMFGIQFKVSAGRCTRGAFVQLLPIEMALREKLKCDYILVIDTEGLCSLECELKKDKEIATFVIGLADITIVNIFGEVPVHMEDILQTVVHAFLRMKKVRLNPRVLFVHQNVSSLMANRKEAQGRKMFLSKLDKMTLHAAKLESCEERFSSFRDIISFDPETDTLFFPNLWKGDPPMAPVNPGYSESVQSLKAHFLDLVKGANSSRTISKFNIHMTDVWEAVLFEDFVFSFKNSLERFAYMALEHEVNKWTWNLQEQLLEWEQKTKNRIDCADQYEIEELNNICFSEATEIFAKWENITEKEIETFFKESEHKDFFSQWKVQTRNRLLKRFYLEQKTNATNYFEELVSNKRQRADAEKTLQEHLEHIRDHVIKLDPKTDDSITSEALQEIFDKKWSEWMKDLSQFQNLMYQSETIQEKIEHSLQQQVSAFSTLTSISLKANEEMELIVKPDFHLLKQVFMKESYKVSAQDASDKFLSIAKIFLDELETYCFQHFGSNLIDKMFKKVLDAVDKCEVKFSARYKVDLAFVVGEYALYRLKSLADEARKKTECFEDRKETYFYAFKAQYECIAEHNKFSIVLISLLKNSLVHSVSESLPRLVVNEMKATSSVFDSKFSLKIAVLTQIAMKREFEDFFQYIDDIERSFMYWIRVFVEEHCNAKSHDCESTRIEVLVESRLEKLIDLLEKAALSTMNEELTLESWLEMFHKAVTSDGEISLSLNEILMHVRSNLNYIEFKADFLARIDEIKLCSKTVIEKKEWKDEVVKILFSKDLIGCCAQCPFCKEQCDHGVDHGDDIKHSVQFHRPQCLGTYHFSGDDSMMLDICTSSVAGLGQFKSSALDDGNYHHYFNYQKFYPKWRIVPNASASASLYWKWFAANYTNEIATKIRSKEANIPSDWKKITQDQAIESLQTLCVS